MSKFVAALSALKKMLYSCSLSFWWSSSESPRGLLILDVEMMSSFEFSLALFGYLIRLGHKPLSCFSLSSCISSDGALTSFILDLELPDRCDLKSSRLRIWFLNRLKKIAVILSVCVLRVGSDIFESARILLWVNSLQLESARLALHTLNSSGRVGSLVFESARTACHQIGRSGRVGSWTLGSARVLMFSEHFQACHHRVDSTIIRVGSST